MPTKDKVLLIGGNGFLGRHLTTALHAGGYGVCIFDRLTDAPAPEGTEIIFGDIADTATLGRAMAGCRDVIYLAHERGSSPYTDPDSLAITRNMELFIIAMATARSAGVQRVMLFSSGGAVYGVPSQIPVAESASLDPISAYGVAKVGMEKYLHMFVRLHGMRHLIVRPSNPYGPGQNFLAKQGVITVFLHHILRGLPIEVWGDGLARKDYIFVDDMAAGICAMLRDPALEGTFNIGSGQGTSLNEIIAAIKSVTGKAPVIAPQPALPNNVPEIILDTTLITRTTGWKTTTSLHEGIALTWQWLQSLPKK